MPMPVAIVRAGAFIENNLGAMKRAAAHGWFDTFLQPTDRAVPMVATVDIGREVAKLLIQGWSGNKVVELGSRYSADDLAAAMSQALGRPVQARPIPRDQWTDRLLSMGLPAEKIGPLQVGQRDRPESFQKQRHGSA